MKLPDKVTGADFNHAASYFARVSQDMTPATMRNNACMLFAPVSSDPAVSALCATTLSEIELQRAARFVSKQDKALFTQRRAFRRFCAITALGSTTSPSRAVFTETRNGRPFLPGSPKFWFSFSACRSGVLGAWSATHGIGVDIEDQTGNPAATELANHYYHRTEAEFVAGTKGSERIRRFFKLWSLKEAGLKSIGEGLPRGLDAFEFQLEPVLQLINAPAEYGGVDQFLAHSNETSGCCVALVIRRLSGKSQEFQKCS